ncbi:hypothetical protein ACTD5D_10320 [Nocardia takedensis]|uniref:hypothetical protein n=1 Tax=Nocardia takedensis TaxID=259390 RepID=UPI003F761A40
MQERLVHVRVTVGALTLDYIAPLSQATDVAHVLSACHPRLDVSVALDDDLRAGLPPLPCSRLWDGPACRIRHGT